MLRPPAVKRVQGYLACKKTPPLGPYRRPMPRVLGGSSEGGRLHERGIPVWHMSDSQHQILALDFW